jgi:two-component system, OmpR family, sensor histidine kinase BaeS
MRTKCGEKKNFFPGLLNRQPQAGQHGAMKGLLAKILTAQVISVVLALLVMTIVTRISLHHGFMDFLERQEADVLGNLSPVLADVYQSQGSWDFLRDNPNHWQQFLRPHPSAQAGADGHGPQHPARRSRPYGAGPPAFADGEQQFRWLRMHDRLQLRDRLFLLDAQQGWVAGARGVEPGGGSLIPVGVDGAAVGWVGFAPIGRARPPEVERFLGGQLRALILTLVFALGLAAGLGFLLARHLSRPVRALDDTVRELSNGHFDRRAAVHTGDEIGALALNINRLGETLEKNRSSRQRWMADVAHELRTPVAILKGEVEALADGVRQLDARAISSLSEEIEQLSTLIGDLQTLALSDAGSLSLSREPLDLRALVQQVAESFREHLAARGISIELDAPQDVRLTADPQRLRQLLQNLLENTARYVLSGGTVRVALAADDEAVELTVEDSGPGVAEAQLGSLFERFYRVEQGRSRVGGGSGLGLSICRNIVEAHDGRIRAETSPLGGLAIHVRLPK